jgi:hypothetical protein
MDFDGNTITERVLEIAKVLKLRDVQLAKELGVSRHNMTKFRGNTAAFPAWRVVNFLSRHREEQINTDWVFFGEGEMFCKESIDKMTMTENGEMIFTSVMPGEKSEVMENEEIKRVQAVLREKEEHIEILKEAIESQKKTIENQDKYIEKLLDKL